MFEAARRLTTWHYHWLVVTEFLPQIVGQDMVDRVLRRGRRFYTPARGAAFMPVEFQTGTYRMGHSMVRPSYRANLAGDNGQPFFAFIFDPSQDGQADPDDLRGGARAPRRFIGWQTFFDFGDGQVKPNKRIDTKISTALFHLPLGAIASHDAPTALAQRNLLRHLTWQLPSGQSVARAIGVTPLAARRPAGARLPRRRIRAQHAALVLRPQGGRNRRRRPAARAGRRAHRRRSAHRPAADRRGSYLTTQPRWRPTLPAKSGTFRMTDFLTFAGVDPQSRGQ